MSSNTDTTQDFYSDCLFKIGGALNAAIEVAYSKAIKNGRTELEAAQDVLTACLAFLLNGFDDIVFASHEQALKAGAAADGRP